MDVNAPKMKSGKQKGSQKKEKELPTATIQLAYAEHDKSKEASNVTVVFMHVLMVADTVTITHVGHGYANNARFLPHRF